MAALLATACARAPDQGAEVLAEIMETQRASLAAVGRPIPAPPPQPARATPPAASGASPAVARGPAPGSSGAFMGATPDTLRRWLGEPRLVRAEGDAQVWLYQGSDCHLDLVLYPESGAMRVAYAAARASGTERRTEASCLSDIARPGMRAAR